MEIHVFRDGVYVDRDFEVSADADHEVPARISVSAGKDVILDIHLQAAAVRDLHAAVHKALGQPAPRVSGILHISRPKVGDIVKDRECERWVILAVGEGDFSLECLAISGSNKGAIARFNPGAVRPAEDWRVTKNDD